MEKKQQTTYISLGIFFLILVGLGTMNKNQELMVVTNTNLPESYVATQPLLPALTGDSILTVAQLPALEALPSINGITVTTADDLPALVTYELSELSGDPVLSADDLPHLTLPSLEG